MEVEESSDQTSTNSSNDNNLNYECQIWVVMNNTFLTIFPTLDYENSEDSLLHQLLESLLSFTIWLFGATFYLISVLVSSASLQKIIDIQVIEESDVSVWPKDRLKSQLLEILVYSEPRVKLAAIKICIEMIDYCLLNNSDMQSLILYATEIVKSLSI